MQVPEYAELDTINPDRFPDEVIDDVVYFTEGIPMPWHPRVAIAWLLILVLSVGAAMLARSPIARILYSPVWFITAFYISLGVAVYIYFTEIDWRLALPWICLVPGLYLAGVIAECCASFVYFYLCVLPPAMAAMVWIAEGVIKLNSDARAVQSRLSLEARNALDADWANRWKHSRHRECILGLLVPYSLGLLVLVCPALGAGVPQVVTETKPLGDAVFITAVISIFALFAVIRRPSLGPQTQLPFHPYREVMSACDIWLRHEPHQPRADGVFAPRPNLGMRMLRTAILFGLMYLTVLPAASYFPLGLLGHDPEQWRHFVTKDLTSRDETKPETFALTKEEFRQALNYRAETWIPFAFWGLAVKSKRSPLYTAAFAVPLCLVAPGVLFVSVIYYVLVPLVPHYRMKVLLLEAIERKQLQDDFYPDNRHDMTQE